MTSVQKKLVEEADNQVGEMNSGKHVDNVDNSVHNSFFQKLTGNCVWINSL